MFLIALTFVGVLSVPVLGEEAQEPVALPFALEGADAFCPAERSDLALPDVVQEARPRIRTCRCSCGYPCRSDEDCGPGGRCTVGITCC